MQSMSANFNTITAAVARQIAYKLEVRWDGTNWTDETSRMQLDFAGALRLNAPGDDLIPPGDVGKLTLTLDNNDDRFTWKYAGSPLAASINSEAGLGYKAVRLKVGFAGEFCTIFTGVIAGWQPTGSYVTLDVRDMGWLYLQLRTSTALYVGYTASDWITALANLAGIAVGDRAISPFIYRIPFCWLDDEAILEEMWAAAASEAGRVWFDELGKLRAEPAPWGAAATAPVWNFGAGYVDANASFTTETVVNKITAEWSGRAAGNDTTLWTLDQRKVIPPGGYIDVEAKFDQPALYVYPLNANGNKDVYVASAGGVSMMPNLSFNIQYAYAQRQKMRLSNLHATWTMVVNRLQLRGVPLIGGPDEQVEVTAATNYLSKDRVRGLPTNPYFQTREQALTTATIAATRLSKVQRLIPLRGVPGIPQLELGDRVQATLPGSATLAGYVQTLNFRCENGGFVQDIDVIDAADLFEYTNYFVIGNTQLGTSGRYWY